MIPFGFTASLNTPQFLVVLRTTPSGSQRHRLQGLRRSRKRHPPNQFRFFWCICFRGKLSDATSSDGADSISVSGSASAAYATGNGGNDTLYIAGAVLATRVFGGQATIQSMPPQPFWFLPDGQPGQGHNRGG